MDVVRWLNRLEARCGPVLAWGVAVALVVAVLPVFLAGRLLMESCCATAARVAALDGALPGQAAPEPSGVGGNAP
jgi:hypothetical protein